MSVKRYNVSIDIIKNSTPNFQHSCEIRKLLNEFPLNVNENLGNSETLSELWLSGTYTVAIQKKD